MDERVTPGSGGMDAGYVPEPEFYVEPPQMRPRDAIGVVVALLALAVIGISGYIWLNPDLNSARVTAWMHLGTTGQESTSSSDQLAIVSDSDSSSTAPVQHSACPYCGMFTDQSEGQVEISFASDDIVGFDSWDCAFKYASENKLAMLNPQVMQHGSPSEKPVWLNASSASYLYDTAEVVGSMPPFVAAFPDRGQAETARKDMGGELVDFTGLKAKWEKK